MDLYCCICGNKLGLRKVVIRNMNYLCFDCVKKAGFNPLTWTGNLKTDREEILNRISDKDFGGEKNH